MTLKPTSAEEAFAPRVPPHVPAHLVQDWNFQSAPGLESDPQATIDRLREGPDIVFSASGRRGRSSWIFKRYEHIVEAVQDTETFSSDHYSGFSSLIGEDWPMIPSDVDAPMHRPYRMMLQKVFAPGEMAKLEEGITETVRALIAAAKSKPQFDFQEMIGRPLPTTVFLRLMGLPLDHAERFLEWEHLLMHGVDLDDRARGVRAIKDYLVESIHDRETAPRQDIMSYVVHAEVEGRRLELWEKLGACFVLYAAGLDTVASGLGFIFKFLAENPEHQEVLRRNPELRNRAVEELLRANSMVVIGRWVTRDIEFHGVTLKKGDFVSLPTLFADRDEEMFTCPTQVDFDRKETMRHIVFGSGPHNCLGSHLARREIRIVMDEWFDACPPFRLKADDKAVTYGGAVFGVESLPLEWLPHTD